MRQEKCTGEGNGKGWMKRAHPLFFPVHSGGHRGIGMGAGGIGGV